MSKLTETKEFIQKVAMHRRASGWPHSLGVVLASAGPWSGPDASPLSLDTAAPFNDGE